MKKRLNNSLRWVFMVALLLWEVVALLCFISECHLAPVLFLTVKALSLGSLILCGFLTVKMLEAGLLPDEFENKCYYD